MIYTFGCLSCGRFFEKEIKISEYGKYPVHCSNPYCNSTYTFRTFRAATNVIFKGSGFTKSVKEEE
jgi:predicted nucleic acid-binding Zn ribbon protein